MPKIITVGEILVEIMAKHVGQDFMHPGIFEGPFPSGAPANFIDQVAKMGVECGIVSRVGQDDFGKMNIERLEKDGVDVSNIFITPGRTTGTAFVTYYKDGSRKFLFHFTNAACGILSPDDINTDYIKSAEYLHIMGCSISASDSMRKAILKAVEIAVNNHVKISFDPNIRPELLDAAETRKAFESILQNTDVLLTSKEELCLLTDMEDTEGGAVLKFMTGGISLVVVKSGSKGARIYKGSQSVDVPPFKVKEVDPTGAGDCFDGAFLSCLTENMDVKEAGLMANAAGALGVTIKGPMEGAFLRKDIEEFVKKKQ